MLTIRRTIAVSGLNGWRICKRESHRESMPKMHAHAQTYVYVCVCVLNVDGGMCVRTSGRVLLVCVSVCEVEKWGRVKSVARGDEIMHGAYCLHQCECVHCIFYKYHSRTDLLQIVVNN